MKIKAELAYDEDTGLFKLTLRYGGETQIHHIMAFNWVDAACEASFIYDTLKRSLVHEGIVEEQAA